MVEFTKQYPLSDEKKGDGSSGASDVEVSTVKKPYEFYDPMKETRATRLGLTLESFKQAPGSTGGQVCQPTTDSGSGVERLTRSSSRSSMVLLIRRPVMTVRIDVPRMNRKKAKLTLPQTQCSSSR